MKVARLWGIRLVAVWFILTGLAPLVPALDVIPGYVMALLALIGGVLLLVDR